MQYIDGSIRFSPGDLTRFLESEYSAWMDRWYLERQNKKHDLAFPSGFENSDSVICQPDETDEELELMASKGIEHEKAFLKSLYDDGKQIVEIPSGLDSLALTHDALVDGPEIIFQAHLVYENFGGYADFLTRQPGSSNLGDYHYEVWDTKLAKSPKPYFIIQLCAYAEMLEAIQGRRPEGFEVVLGTKERVRFETNKYFYYFRALKQSFLEFQEHFDISDPPHPGLSRNHGRWSEYAGRILEAEDHLSKVANISRVQIKKLEVGGIDTLETLAHTEIDHVPKLATESFNKLKRQARLQFQSIGQERPLFEVIPSDVADPRRGLELLPPACDQDVFFDMEGFPLHEGGLEYLFGAICLDKGEPKFHDWWAHDKQQEKKAFEEFIDWAHVRWQANPEMHIYHYAVYEVATIKRLMGQFATREEKVDDLLRNQVFVDLYTVVRQGLAIGTPSYSLKDVEHLYLEKREGGVTTSGGSIIAYHNWIESGQSQNWKESEILKEIRDYNEVDCVSTWKLAEWLRVVQRESNVLYVAPNDETNDNNGDPDDRIKAPASILADQLLMELKSSQFDNEHFRVQQLLAWLLEFHWRETRPVFWRKYAMHDMTDAELIDNFDCLGGLTRTEKPKRPIKRSFAYEYRFDASQETKLHEGSKCFLANDLKIRTEITTIDPDNGLVEIKLGPSVSKPTDRLGLIPDEHVSAKAIARAVYRYVDSWQRGDILCKAVDDLINRRPPRILGHASGPVIDFDKPLLDATIDVIRRMDETLLCVQGPPGTGKTFTAANAILQLLMDGKRIAVTANGHKAILNILKATKQEIKAAGLDFQVYKVGGDADDPIIEDWEISHVRQGNKAVDCLSVGPIVVGGTSWVFSRPELQGKFDYLFVDEAGQFSLANVVATGCCASNVVLVGDQMQLSQPTLGTHPGESGMSALEYYLDGHRTIPPDFGVLLNQSWRMHPSICDFVSDAFYESRLCAHPKTANQRIVFGEMQEDLLQNGAGLHFFPVVHDGNKQCSIEEVDVVAKLFNGLLGTPYIDFDGVLHDSLTLNDILVVAPYNMQVRMLKQKLGDGARVGTVDKFQGQQAPVVIVSLGSSSLEDSPRGASFLLDPNRLNVAISRAKSMAVIVASPEIASAKCRSILEIELANPFCRLVESARTTKALNRSCLAFKTK